MQLGLGVSGLQSMLQVRVKEHWHRDGLCWGKRADRSNSKDAILCLFPLVLCTLALPDLNVCKLLCSYRLVIRLANVVTIDRRYGACQQRAKVNCITESLWFGDSVGFECEVTWHLWDDHLVD